MHFEFEDAPYSFRRTYLKVESAAFSTPGKAESALALKPCRLCVSCLDSCCALNLKCILTVASPATLGGGAPRKAALKDLSL